MNHLMPLSNFPTCSNVGVASFLGLEELSNYQVVARGIFQDLVAPENHPPCFKIIQEIAQEEQKLRDIEFRPKTFLIKLVSKLDSLNFFVKIIDRLFQYLFSLYKKEAHLQRNVLRNRIIDIKNKIIQLKLDKQDLQTEMRKIVQNRRLMTEFFGGEEVINKLSMLRARDYTAIKKNLHHLQITRLDPGSMNYSVMRGKESGHFFFAIKIFDHPYDRVWTFIENRTAWSVYRMDENYQLPSSLIDENLLDNGRGQGEQRQNWKEMLPRLLYETFEKQASDERRKHNTAEFFARLKNSYQA